MIGLPCDEESMTMSSRFHRIPERDGRVDRQTDRHNVYINIAR